MEVFKFRLITSALPYANGSIHIGHLVEYIQTDIVVRAFKLMGEDTIYICADDTHGTAIQIRAEKEGITPEELIARYNKEHQEDFSLYSIEFDNYYSTNSEENKKWADYIFNKLKEKGLIYTKDVEQTYCEHCKRFLPDRFVKGKCPKCGAEDQYGDVCEKCNSTYKPTELIEPYCSICHNTPVRKSSLHYFFKLSSMSDKLKNYIENNNRLQKEVKNHILKWIDDGLQDWDISRDGPYFGFKIPGEEDKYYYVWLDAPVGYISSTEDYCKKKGCNVEDYWKSDKSEIIHFIGKDIMYFHLLFWPAMLMESGLHLPDDVVVHGFLKVNGEKMSKSRGTFLTAKEMANIIKPELLRYYYASNLTHSVSDIDLDLDDFKNRINNELIANVFNFIYRTLSFTNKYFEGEVLPYEKDKLIEDALNVVEDIKEKYKRYELREVVKDILKLSSMGNRYFQENEPWKLVKEDKEKAQRVLSNCVNIVKFIGACLKPIMPKTVVEIEKQLSIEELNLNVEPFFEHIIGDARPIIEKIENIEIGKKVFPLDLRVGVVEEVKDHPNAEKLYLLRINMGDEKRQLVAGLKKYYKKYELVGKHLVIVSNMKPAVLRGEKSEGMLLAGDDKDNVKVLEAPNSEAGEKVIVGNYEPSQEKVDIKVVLGLELYCKDKKAYYKDNVLKTSKEDIFVGLDIGKIR